MSLVEAEELLSFVELDHAPGRVDLRRLGNNWDYVLVVRSCTYFLWSVDDWLQYRQQEEDAILARQQEFQEVS